MQHERPQGPCTTGAAAGASARVCCCQVYDPGNTGFADPEILRAIFTSLDYGEITDEDLQASDRHEPQPCDPATTDRCNAMLALAALALSLSLCDWGAQVLVQAADVDGDGKISLEDFRGTPAPLCVHMWTHV